MLAIPAEAGPQIIVEDIAALQRLKRRHRRSGCSKLVHIGHARCEFGVDERGGALAPGDQQIVGILAESAGKQPFRRFARFRIGHLAERGINLRDRII